MGYKVLSPDTHPEVEKVMFEHLRRMGRQQRFERGLRRVDASLESMWRAFRRTHPHLSEDEMHIEWVRVQFGEDLAARLKEWLECRAKMQVSKTSPPTTTTSATP
jgi:uncharacterized membrane protein YccC